MACTKHNMRMIQHCTHNNRLLMSKPITTSNCGCITCNYKNKNNYNNPEKSLL